MQPIMNFNREFTPKYFKHDFSPVGFRAFLPSVLSPVTKQDADEGPKTTKRKPLQENLDFATKARAVTTSLMMPFNSSFVPRTPVAVLKSSKKEAKDVFPMKSFNPTKDVSSNKEFSNDYQTCPCCAQQIPQDMKLVNTTQTKEDSSSSQEGSKRKGRKRKNKEQIKFLDEEFSNNPHWTNEDVERISRKLGLEKSKVYKWNWDRKKKLNIIPSKVYAYEVQEGKIYVKGGSNSEVEL